MIEAALTRADNFLSGSFASMAKPKLPLKRRLLRLFLWLTGIALAFFTYGALLGSQTDSYIMARYTAHEMPEVNIVPQPLRDLTTSQAPGTDLSYYGNSFEAPWKGITEQKTYPAATIVKFASGQTLMTWVPMGKLGILEDIASDKTTGGPAMRILFADDLKTTPYDQESALLRITSGQVKFFDPRRVSARRFFLLFFKAMSEIESSTGVYDFQTSAVRGFQLGNPANTWRTRLDFFDSHGNALGEISCWFGGTASARGTQAELNRIIQTFHPIGAYPAAPAPVSHAVSPNPSR